MADREKNTKCKKYGLAITDYVLGEEMDISRDELFNHLRACEKCRRDIFDWQDTYAVMRTEAHFAKPETKKRYAELLEKIKGKTGEKKPIEDVKGEIDSAAGTIYNFIKDYTGSSNDKKIAIRVIRKGTYLVDYPFYEAMGVLITNEKVIVDKDKDNRPAYVSAQPGA